MPLPGRLIQPRTRHALRPLDEPYRSRSVPPGTPQYWSWLFASRDARDPLLGAFALMAEWRALMDPGTELSAAHMKLAWWREEIGRMTSGSPLHPITRYIAQLPRAAGLDAEPLGASLEAAAAQVAGVPLERADELQSHAAALYGTPLLFAALVAGAPSDQERLRRCVTALAAGQYLTRAVADYGRETRVGRIPFAVDELLAAGIDNDDLLAAEPPDRLRSYLDELRQRAAEQFAMAADALAPAERPNLRHLLVLAALGREQLQRRRNPSVADFRLADLYKAWNTARRAAAR